MSQGRVTLSKGGVKRVKVLKRLSSGSMTNKEAGAKTASCVPCPTELQISRDLRADLVVKHFCSKSYKTFTERPTSEIPSILFLKVFMEKFLQEKFLLKKFSY
jgi:hypothetical protein